MTESGAGLRRLRDITPEPVRRVARRRLSGRYVAAARKSAQPQISVVIPVYNVATYLAECLDSVLDQSLRNLEIICVDDGSTDDSVAILREYEQREPRVRVFEQSNSGQGVARNLGVEHARGEFLTFVDSDDVLPRNALQLQVDTLTRTGSDFTVGAPRRFANKQFMPVSWNKVVHRRDRLATTIDEFPQAMQDILCCNRVFRTSFWREKVGSFRGHIAYEDHVPMLTAYVRAGTFDVLAATTYHWRVREDNTSTGQQKAKLENLLDRIAVKEEAHHLLVEEATSATYDAWVSRVLDVDLPSFISHAVGASQLYRSVLAATYRTFIDRAPATARRQVRHQQKLRGWLVAQERWDDLGEPMEMHRRLVGQLPATKIVEGWPRALPVEGFELAGEAPAWVRELAAFETPLDVVIQRVLHQPGSTLVTLQGWAIVRGIDSGPDGFTPTIGLDVVNQLTGEREPVTVTQRTTAEATRWGGNPCTRYDQSGFTATFDLAAVAARWPVDPATHWTLDFDVVVGEQHRSGPALHQQFGSGGMFTRRYDVTGLTKAAELDDFVLQSAHDSTHGYGWRVVPTKAVKRTLPTGPVLVRDWQVDDDSFTVEATASDPALLATLTLGNDRASLPLLGEDACGDQGRRRLRFARDVSILGGPTLPMPSGDITLRYRDGDKLKAARTSAELAERLPLEAADSRSHVWAQVQRDGTFFVTIKPPLSVVTMSNYGQRSAQRHFRVADFGRRPGVLFQCYRGEYCTDSQRALDAGVRELLPDLPRYWGVQDHGTPLPPGAIGVVMGSQEWFEILGSVDYLCNNIDFDGFFIKRPHQRYLQTFHGYPFKSMGKSFWTGKGFDRVQIATETARRNREWDTILVPADFCADFYRSEYDYTGEILDIGYPRGDFLVRNRGSAGQAIRDDVLRRLGVDGGQTVVLYAPTYRDNLTTRTFAAKRFDELDLVELCSALGPGVTILLRGHNNNQRELERVLAIPGVVDVTDYPEINELTVAADVAILDYSSLRFDWALTGKPMIFFVPDRDTYFGSRPPLWPYPETTPGPLADTTSDVIAALRDLPGLAARYGVDIEAFNQRYNAAFDGSVTERIVRHFFVREFGG